MAGDRFEKQKLRARLKATLRQAILLKYLLLGFLLLVVVALPGVQWDNLTFHPERIWETIRAELISVVAVSILLAFISDFLVRSQQDEIRKLDQTQLVDSLAARGLLERGASKLSADDAAMLVEPLLQSETFLEALANRTARSSLTARNVLESYFYPLWAEPIVHFNKWQNWLEVDANHADTYRWRSVQTFTTYEKTAVHRVVITDDVAVGDQLLNSGVHFNNIVVIGRNDQQLLDQLLPTFILKMNNARIDGWKLVPFKQRKFEELFHKRKVPDRFRHIDPAALRIIEFVIDSDVEENAFHFEFVVPCSLDEPFFAIEAERICFIDSISINFLGIAHLLDTVWPSSFIANRSVELLPIGADKVFEARVNGLIMGGHGISLNWKRKSA